MALRQGRSNYPGKQMVVVTRDPPKKKTKKRRKMVCTIMSKKQKQKTKTRKMVPYATTTLGSLGLQVTDDVKDLKFTACQLMYTFMKAGV